MTDPNPDAELLAVCQKFLDADRQLVAWDAEKLDVDEDIVDDMVGEMYDLRERLLGMRARTPAGIRAKAEVAHAAMRDHRAFEPGTHGDLARSALADFLAGGLDHA